MPELINLPFSQWANFGDAITSVEAVKIEMPPVEPAKGRLHKLAASIDRWIQREVAAFEPPPPPPDVDTQIWVDAWRACVKDERLFAERMSRFMSEQMQRALTVQEALSLSRRV